MERGKWCVIDPTFDDSNKANFFLHSITPNMKIERGLGLGLKLTASREILSGELLTWDYGQEKVKNEKWGRNTTVSITIVYYLLGMYTALQKFYLAYIYSSICKWNRTFGGQYIAACIA